MAEGTVTTKPGDGGVHDTDATVPKDPGDEGARHSDGTGSRAHEEDKSDEPKQLPLHKKLLERSKAEEPANEATLEDFKALIREKASGINTLDEDGKTVLHVAIERGLTTEARCIIDGKADIAKANNEGQQPLYLACEKGHTELVRLLLSKGAKINAASNRGETPLVAACRNEHTEVVDILLDEKADANASDKRDCTPLFWASARNLKETVERLLKVDITNIDATMTFLAWTPLNAAAYTGRKEVVSLLLEKNADLSIKNLWGWTPLMAATVNKHPEVVRSILTHKGGCQKPYLEIRDNSNNTALHRASREGLCEIATLLVGAGADCTAKDGRGMTPLHLASFHNHSKIVDLLLSETPALAVDVDAKASDEKTPLHLSSLQGNELIVKTLHKRKACIHAKDKAGMTPLHLASGANEDNRCGSDPDPISPEPGSDNDPRMENKKSEAESGRHLQVVEFLLQNGADTSIKASNGDTALHCAAAVGDKARIDVLLREMKEGEFSWGDWKDSPVNSALTGSNPLAAMGSLLDKQELMNAAFWKQGGRIQVITEATKIARPYKLLDLLFGKLKRDSDSSPEGCGKWGPFQWAAHERLPDVLSVLINMSGSVENADKMIHEALQVTCDSIISGKLYLESYCELLVQVVWILITNSERVPENKRSVEAARDSICSFIEDHALVMKSLDSLEGLLEEMTKMSDVRTEREKKFSLAEGKERLQEGRETAQPDPGDVARNLEGHETKDKEPRKSKKGKRIAMLNTLHDILKDPPFAQMSQTHKDKGYYDLPVPESDHRKLLEKAEATVVGFFKRKGESGRIRRNRSIQEIVYDVGPANVMGIAIRNLIDINDMTGGGSMQFNSKLYAKMNLHLTWVHLPSTNMIWMNDLLTRVMLYEGYGIREYYEARSFFRDSWVEVPDGDSRSRMMRPQSVTRPRPDDSILEESTVPKPIDNKKREKENEGRKVGVEEKNDKDTTKAQMTGADPEEDPQKVYDEWITDSSLPGQRSYKFVPASAIYMPYLVYSTHCRHYDNDRLPEDLKLKEAHDLYEELQTTYEGKNKKQHGSPTLDEWYYQFAQEDDEAKDDRDSRNEGQVVSKYLKENPKTNDAHGVIEPNRWTVVRVNQLWIWTISEDWIFTATSSPLENSPDALVEDILNHLGKQADYGGSQAQPACATELVPVIVNHCIGSYEKRPPDVGRISIGQTFSHYINRIGREETALFDNFRALSPNEHQRKNANDEDTSKSMSAAIEKAKRLYCDIKDVRDELNILKSVAQYQQIVQRGLAAKGVDESRFSSTYVVKDLQELDCIADRIQSAINATLSLQQSEVANYQATEATRQGKTVMTFTLATVLFLPLSFLSSLFALDVASFREAPAWAFYVIFFVSIGISTILGCSVLYWDDIKRSKKTLFDIVKRPFRSSFSPTLRPSQLPEKEATESKDKGGHDTVAGISSKSKNGEPGLGGLFRRHGRKVPANDIEIGAQTG